MFSGSIEMFRRMTKGFKLGLLVCLTCALSLRGLDRLHINEVLQAKAFVQVEEILEARSLDKW